MASLILNTSKQFVKPEEIEVGDTFTGHISVGKNQFDKLELNLKGDTTTYCIAINQNVADGIGISYSKDSQTFKYLPIPQIGGRTTEGMRATAKFLGKTVLARAKTKDPKKLLPMDFASLWSIELDTGSIVEEVAPIQPETNPTAEAADADWGTDQDVPF